MTLSDELRAMEAKLSEKRAKNHAQACKYVSPRGPRGPKVQIRYDMPKVTK